jgi:hypothetical protein
LYDLNIKFTGLQLHKNKLSSPFLCFFKYSEEIPVFMPSTGTIFARSNAVEAVINKGVHLQAVVAVRRDPVNKAGSYLQCGLCRKPYNDPGGTEAFYFAIQP